MCSYRRVVVTYPGGRVMRLIVAEDRDNGHRCESCGLDAVGFARRHLPPHDTLQHQELYFGATVKRGRRLSAGEVDRLGLAPRPQPELVEDKQLSFPLKHSRLRGGSS